MRWRRGGAPVVDGGLVEARACGGRLALGAAEVKVPPAAGSHEKHAVDQPRGAPSEENNVRRERQRCTAAPPRVSTAKQHVGPAQRGLISRGRGAERRVAHCASRCSAMCTASGRLAKAQNKRTCGAGRAVSERGAVVEGLVVAVNPKHQRITLRGARAREHKKAPRARAFAPKPPRPRRRTCAALRSSSAEPCCKSCRSPASSSTSAEGAEAQSSACPGRCQQSACKSLASARRMARKQHRRALTQGAEGTRADMRVRTRYDHARAGAEQTNNEILHLRLLIARI